MLMHVTLSVQAIERWYAVTQVRTALVWFAVTQGMNSFDHYKDPVTGKEGKINVRVTVGPYRGHKLVRPHTTTESCRRSK